LGFVEGLLKGEVIKIVTIKVSELLKMAQQLSDDGIKYVNIDECESDEELPKCLSFSAYSEDSMYEIDYEEIDHVEVK